jgi:hypothetical protein
MSSNDRPIDSELLIERLKKAGINLKVFNESPSLIEGRVRNRATRARSVLRIIHDAQEISLTINIDTLWVRARKKVWSKQARDFSEQNQVARAKTIANILAQMFNLPVFHVYQTPEDEITIIWPIEGIQSSVKEDWIKL